MQVVACFNAEKGRRCERVLWGQTLRRCSRRRDSFRARTLEIRLFDTRRTTVASRGTVTSSGRLDAMLIPNPLSAGPKTAVWCGGDGRSVTKHAVERSSPSKKTTDEFPVGRQQRTDQTRPSSNSRSMRWRPVCLVLVYSPGRVHHRHHEDYIYILGIFELDLPSIVE